MVSRKKESYLLVIVCEKHFSLSIVNFLERYPQLMEAEPVL